MGGIVAKPTKANLVAVCMMVIDAIHRGLKSITINGVTIGDFKSVNWCARNVRLALGATKYGDPWGWPYAACCATSMAKKLRAAGLAVPRKQAQPGDVIAFASSAKGAKCSQCGSPVGHVGIYMGDNKLYQNTSYGRRGTCIIPIRSEQWDALLGVFEVLPDAAERPILVVDHGTGEVLGYVVDGGLHVDDQRKVYVELT